MLFIISVFLLALGHGGAEAWQKLTCPLKEQHQGIRMVWCRRTSSDCCIGLSFGPGVGLLDGGRLSVTRRPDSFTVEVLEPNHREGLYWCGGMGENSTIVKLAERRIYSSFGSYLWSLARWSLLPLLPLMDILIYCYYSRIAAKPVRKRAKDLSDDVSASRMEPRH